MQLVTWRDVVKPCFALGVLTDGWSAVPECCVVFSIICVCVSVFHLFTYRKYHFVLIKFVQPSWVCVSLFSCCPVALSLLCRKPSVTFMVMKRIIKAAKTVSRILAFFSAHINLCCVVLASASALYRER